jgi:hypothetical protein
MKRVILNSNAKSFLCAMLNGVSLISMWLLLPYQQIYLIAYIIYTHPVLP